ncbi:hypothetical protein FQN49_001425 [Arthroderma sp. PD_2]|nr:hypothetical protein FQN49_001425 [Arthroderma sp. PD_2]
MIIKVLYTAFLLAIFGAVSGLPTRESVSEAAYRTKGDLQGRGTIYYQYGAYGSCGVKHADGDFIVALGKTYMKSYKSPNCGRHITARNTSNGKTVNVIVADTCEKCGPGDVDFALGPWNALTNNAAPGLFTVSWYVPHN